MGRRAAQNTAVGAQGPIPLTFDLLGYRLLSRFAEVLPGRAVRPLSAFAGRVGCSVLTERRHLVERNLRRVTGESPSQAQVRAAFASYCRYWLDTMKLPVVPRDALDDLLSIDGLENLEEALAGGRGVVAAVPHLGNWDVAGAWVAANEKPTTVVVERLEPEQLFIWFRDFRASLGLSIAVNGPRVGLELLAALRRNEIVALLCDRDVDGTGLEVEFFGEVTRLPRGPAALALRSGAPILPVAVYEEGSRYAAIIGPPVTAERTGTLAEDIDRVTRAIAAEMEKLIHRAPEQWHLFTPNWPSDR